MNDKGLVRMEKRAANKGGLFLIILIALVGLGVGGYFLYQNKDEITWPWQEKEEKEDDKPSESGGNSNNSSGGKLHLPEISPEVDVLQLRNAPSKLHITKLKATTKGYELDFKLVMKSGEEDDTEDIDRYTVNCTKILVDDYEVTPTFKVEVTQAQKTGTTSVIIPMSELENLEITSFRALRFFFTINSVVDGFEQNENKVESRITAYQDVFVDNTKKTKGSFAVQDSVRISYYKKIEAEDATYLYYIIENNNKVQSHKIELKKLVINDEIYNKVTVNVDTHYNSNTIFYIKIPRKDFEEINKITSSFFILRPEGKDQAIFMTNDLLIDYTKEETK